MHTDLWRLTRDVAVAQTQGTGLSDCLRRCAEALVSHLDAAFARIWTLNDTAAQLELKASAGIYTHLDGAHGRIPLGRFKIGRIAETREPHLTNQVIGDPRVGDQEWARREAMVAFAGYPLICEDRVVGVMALFSRHELATDTLEALAAVADIIATGIAHWTAVELLYVSEERFELAIRGSGAGLWDWNVLTGHVDFAPRFKELLGYKVEELEDSFESFETRLHPDDHDRILKAVADHLNDRVPYAVDYRLMTKNEGYRWFHARGQAIWDQNSKATRMLGSIADITDRKRSEERFRLLVEASPDALVITDPRGRIVKVNSRAEQQFGYPKDELLGQAVEILVPERFSNNHAILSQAYVETAQVRPMGNGGDLFGKHRDGHEFPVEISLSPVETEEGLLIAATVRNITVRKRVENALRESEERMRSIVTHIVEGIITIDTAGLIRSINPAVERIFGYSEEALLGRDVNIIMPEPFHSAHDGYLANYLRTGESKIIGVGREVVGRRKDGTTFPLDLSVSEFSLNRVRMYTGVVRDISERKRAEAIVAHQAQELERSNKELEQFAYIASHDLQEPLRKVQSFGDLLVASCGTKISDEDRDYLNRMQSSASRMQGLINDLLSFSRLSSQAKAFLPVDPRQIAEEVVSDLEIRIKSTGGRVEIGALPSLEADSLQMRQLLQNLIGNALKFHRPGVSPVVSVEGRLLPPGEGTALQDTAAELFCEITVKDNGIGFEEKYLDRIFAPFQRLHGRGEYEGSGIGLAICRKIVERHGGTITARSTPGQGTTFIVTLPLRHKDAGFHHA